MELSDIKLAFITMMAMGTLIAGWQIWVLVPVDPESIRALKTEFLFARGTAVPLILQVTKRGRRMRRTFLLLVWNTFFSLGGIFFVDLWDGIGVVPFLVGLSFIILELLAIAQASDVMVRRSVIDLHYLRRILE